MKKSKILREKAKEDAKVSKILRDAVIMAQAILYPCEDYEKVIHALKNVVDGDVMEKSLTESKKLLIVKYRGGEHIIKIFNQFRRRKVLAAVRRYLNKYIDKKRGEVTLFLHKQAAYNEVYSLCEPGESPLGEIVVKIRLKNPEKVVRRLTSF